jgi:hypothetical protein
MIIAGWLLAILGLAQVVYAGTLDVTQVVEGNRLLGIAPSLVANAELVAQRTMIHQSGLAAFLAGAVFLAAAYLKPPPDGVQSKSWVNTGAIAAGSLALAAAIGFAWFVHDLQGHAAAHKLADEARLKQARAEATARMLGPGARGTTQPSSPPGGTTSSPEPAD